jgi:hypothetical protein
VKQAERKLDFLLGFLFSLEDAPLKLGLTFNGLHGVIFSEDGTLRVYKSPQVEKGRLLQLCV